MRTFGKCETRVRDRRIVLRERRRKITFLNPAHQVVRRVQIDGCVITEGLRCDYLLIAKRTSEHYVELKGCDVGHAVSQLEATIVAVSEDAQGAPKYAYVISSRCPLMASDIQKLKLSFRRSFNSTLVVKNSRYEHVL